MGYTPEEEAPACPDEFDDFVTFEASMSIAISRRRQLIAAGDSSTEGLAGEEELLLCQGSGMLNVQ